MENEINFDVMRYELGEDGYITNVYFGCASGTCSAYEGTIPEGYDSLEDWHDSNCDILNAWKIVDGNLVYDEARGSALLEKYEEEDNANRYVYRREIYGLEEKANQNNEALKEQYKTNTLTGNVIEIDDSKALSPNIKITNVVDNIKLVSSNKNVLPNEATTQTINGITFIQNADRSITLNGTATAEIEYNIAGTSTNSSSIFVFKKDVEYYLSSNSHQMKMYNYDGTDREEVYSGTDGVVTFSENKNVTQIVLCVESGATFNEVTIYPQLELGNVATEYVTHEENNLEIDLSEVTGTIDYVRVEGDSVFVSIDNVEESLEDGFLSMHEGYNVVYAMQDALLELTYYTNVLNVDDLSFLQGKATNTNQFKILEDGSIEAHNGTFSGVVTASEGNIGGFSLGEETFTSEIRPHYDFAQADLDKVSAYLLNTGTLTDEELSLYDLDGDGEVTIADSLLISKYIQANATTTEPATLEINSKNPTKTILIKDKDGAEKVNISSLGITPASIIGGVPVGLKVSTKTLKSGFSTTSTTVDFTGYIGVYIRFLPASGSAYVPAFIPANLITTSAVSYQGADESNWVSLSLQKSDSNIVILGKGRSASSGNYAVYGVKLALTYE